MIIPDVSISGLGGHVAISGCRSLSKSFEDTFFDVAVVWELDFVTWITTILILDLFCHISQHEPKISSVSKNSHLFDVVPNNFRCTDWRPDCWTGQDPGQILEEHCSVAQLELIECCRLWTSMCAVWQVRLEPLRCSYIDWKPVTKNCMEAVVVNGVECRAEV